MADTPIKVRATAEYLDWAARLRDIRARAFIEARIRRLAVGHIGDARPVGEGVSELRIHYGPGYRIYFVRRGESLIVLLCGGDKSRQSADIDRALRLARDWSDADGT